MSDLAATDGPLPHIYGVELTYAEYLEVERRCANPMSEEWLLRKAEVIAERKSD